jgi:hypothetical protein
MLKNAYLGLFVVFVLLSSVYVVPPGMPQPAQLLRHDSGATAVNQIGLDKNELIPADPGERVAGAHSATETNGDLLQQAVPGANRHREALLRARPAGIFH